VVILRPSGAESGPALVAIETRLIADWGIWVDGSGVVEGADTEGADHHLAQPIHAGDAWPRWSITQELTRGAGS